jgi:hypothetical protein
MVAKETMIRLRIDVDYAYPSRLKSFLYTALNIRASKDYLKNAKIIARMINESTKEVKAYWFFTPKTIPDSELLDMLDEERHEVSLHIANNPYEEMQLLEKATGRKLRYYTTHGTARLLARVIWKRFKAKVPEIPENFPLESFYQFPVLGLDWLCYANDTAKAVRISRKEVAKGKVLHIHPCWLFQRGTINHRGSFYEAFRRILNVGKEMETIAVKRKLFFKVASDKQEYARDVIPTVDFTKKLGERRIDIFTFIERKWCNTIADPPHFWFKAEDNIALLQVESYEKWWKNVGKKTRNMVRKAEKNGVKTDVVDPSEKLAEGIWKIYNETPIRQKRFFPHYGISLQAVTRNVLSAQNCTFIGAFLQDELVGFIQLVHGDKIAIVAQILSFQRYSDKAVNNALIAKAVEVCATKKTEWVMYGRMGNHYSLDRFKHSNDFTRFSLTRYYVPLTKKGRIAISIRLHRETKDVLPQPMRYPLISLYNWVSRNKLRIKRV